MISRLQGRVLTLTAVLLLVTQGASPDVAGAGDWQALRNGQTTIHPRQHPPPSAGASSAFRRLDAQTSDIRGTTSVAPSQNGASISEAGMGRARPQSSNEPFGLTSFRAPHSELWGRWWSIQEASAAEAKMLARCRADRAVCSEAAVRLVAILDQAGSLLDPLARIAAVNRLVNSAIRYTSDFEQYGVADYWSTPLETFTSGQGDCEDYAIAKYNALREIGFAVSELKLLLGIDAERHQEHAVLGVRLLGRWFILDNLRPLVVVDSEYKTFIPRFALRQGGVDLLAVPFTLSGGVAPEKLRFWIGS